MSRGETVIEHKGATSQRIGLHDIAKALGVSVATVSRVLNGRPDVADGTRARVMEYVREREYSDARSAHRQPSHSLGLIGVTVPRMRGGYFSEILAGITRALEERGARPLISETSRDQGRGEEPYNQEREVNIFKRFAPGTVDGVILVLPSIRSEQLEALLLRDYPVVVVDPAKDVPKTVPVIVSAHMTGAVEATEHLLALGHSRIGVITGPLDEEASRKRLEGYRFSLYKRGLPVDAGLQFISNFEFRGGYEATQELLDRSRPTAIFCFNDAMAAGAIRAAWERGLRLPRDLSIVGFDDAETAQFVTPALTTVSQPLVDLGRTAVDTLYRLREGRPPGAARIELSTHLIVRDSTAAPNVMAMGASPTGP